MAMNKFKRLVLSIVIGPLLGSLIGGLIGGCVGMVAFKMNSKEYNAGFGFGEGLGFGITTGLLFGLLSSWKLIDKKPLQAIIYLTSFTIIPSMLVALTGLAPLAWFAGMAGYWVGFACLLMNKKPCNGNH